jgi:hypothetical protein
MKGENFVPAQHYGEIANAAELPAAAAHIAWLAVADQHGHNQYLQQLEIERDGYPPVITKRFKLIDMGLMFGNGNWSVANIGNVPAAYALPDHLAAKLTLATLAPAIAAVKAAPEAAIRECFADCPDEWNVSDADKQAGAERTIASAAQVGQIIAAGNPNIK